MSTATRGQHDSVCSTHGFTVRAAPSYAPDKSEPSERRYCFTYRITIENSGGQEAKLVSRRWIITDAQGRTHTVEGEGVIGMQPVFQPGVSFQYSSFCPLPTRWGTMEGAFIMLGADGSTFEISIARFYLVAPEDA
jgi:ApaG protein